MNSNVTLRILESVAKDGARSQRMLANEAGIALGLVNAYLRFCVKKGFLRVKQAPARRYAYYLTPRGFSEKSRLTAEHLSSSFSFFRSAKTEMVRLTREIHGKGFSRVALLGMSELAEIAVICCCESSVQIAAIIDDRSSRKEFLRVPIVSSDDGIARSCDALIVTDIYDVRKAALSAVALCGPGRVFLPSLLSISLPEVLGLNSAHER